MNIIFSREKIWKFYKKHWILKINFARKFSFSWNVEWNLFKLPKIEVSLKKQTKCESIIISSWNLRYTYLATPPQFLIFFMGLQTVFKKSNYFKEIFLKIIYFFISTDFWERKKSPKTGKKRIKTDKNDWKYEKQTFKKKFKIITR